MTVLVPLIALWFWRFLYNRDSWAPAIIAFWLFLYRWSYDHFNSAFSSLLGRKLSYDKLYVLWNIAATFEHFWHIYAIFVFQNVLRIVLSNINCLFFQNFETLARKTKCDLRESIVSADWLPTCSEVGLSKGFIMKSGMLCMGVGEYSL